MACPTRDWQMHFRVLGALEAGSGEAVAQLGPPKQRALLAVLLMHVGQIVPTERLIDLLWGEAAPRTASHSIQIYVSELRRALEPLAGRQLIITRPPGYLLDVPREAIDALNFEQLVEDGLKELEAGNSQAARGSLRAALKLWHGPALSDFTYEEFAQPYIRRFHDRRSGRRRCANAARRCSLAQ
jgi:DNA-binding SARP family transcriptional activator